MLKKKHNSNSVMVDVNQTYCAVHFAIYTNIKLLCCIPETSMLYVNYISIK